MEKLLLRTLVLVLLGSTIGLAVLTARGKDGGLLPDLPPQKVNTQNAAEKPVAPASENPASGEKPATEVKVEPVTPTPPVANKPEAKPEKPGSNINDYLIDLATAKKKFDEKSAIFIDAREFIEYTAGHVAGAMSCPKRRFDGAAPRYIREYLPGNAVVVYCHGAECTDSEAVVKRLIALNLQIGPFFILKDGYPAWRDAGYPINTGDNEGFVQ